MYSLADNNSPWQRGGSAGSDSVRAVRTRKRMPAGPALLYPSIDWMNFDTRCCFHVLYDIVYLVRTVFTLSGRLQSLPPSPLASCGQNCPRFLLSAATVQKMLIIVLQ